MESGDHAQELNFHLFTIPFEAVRRSERQKRADNLEENSWKIERK